MNQDTMEIIKILLQGLGVIAFFLVTSRIKHFESTMSLMQKSVTDLNNSVIQLLERDRTKDAQIDSLKDNISLLFGETKQLRDRYHGRVNEDSTKIIHLEMQINQLMKDVATLSKNE